MIRYTPMLAAGLLASVTCGPAAADAAFDKLSKDVDTYTENFQTLLTDGGHAYYVAHNAQEAGKNSDACAAAKVAVAKYTEAKISTLAMANELTAAGDEVDAKAVMDGLPDVIDLLNPAIDIVTKTCKDPS